MDEKCIAFLSVFILRSISGGACSTWNAKLKSSPLQKLHLWGRWQLLLTKYPKVSFGMRNIWMLSSILFGSQEKLTSNQRSLLQRRKIRISQIQAEAAPLLLVCLYFSIFTVQWPEAPSSGNRFYLSQSGVSKQAEGRKCSSWKGSWICFGSQALSGEPGKPCGIQYYLGFFPVCLISGREVIVEELPLMADLSKSTR